MSLPLIALFIAAFAFGTTEFVIAGVLPQVAEGLGVSVPSAGLLVSGYALGIAIGGPLLTLATARLSRRSLLIALAVIFTVGQAACALAPDFVSMLALLVAVYPANVHMALNPEPFVAEGMSLWALYLRLPFQFVFMAWVWWATKPEAADLRPEPAVHARAAS